MPGFANRIAFCRWIYYMKAGSPPIDAAIGTAAGRTQGWASGKDTPLIKDEAPNDRLVVRGLAQFFGVPEIWLADAQDGEAPNDELRDLWQHWESARAKRQHAPKRGGMDAFLATAALIEGERPPPPADQPESKRGPRKRKHR